MEYVTIMRKFGNPQIVIDVSDDLIGISMKLPDFLDALAEEIGNPTMVITKKQLADRISKAADVIVRDMKLETTKVM